MQKSDDYILVRDKDGHLKYFKEGKFYSIDEIDKKPSKTEKKKPKPLSAIKLTPEKEDKDVKKDHGRAKVRGEVNKKTQDTVQDIIKELKVTFTDDKMKKKFTDLITSRLREIRGDKEVRYMLTVPKDEGGFGLPDKHANVVVAVIKKHEEPFIKEKKGLSIKSSEAPKKDSMTEPTTPAKKRPSILGRPKAKKVAPVAPKSHKSVLDRSKPPVAKDRPSILDRPKPAVAPVDDPPVLKKASTAPQPVMSKPIVTSKISKIRHQMPKVDPRGQQDQAAVVKPAMGGVAYRPTLVGPLDELESLDLTNFRRMGSSAEDIKNEIVEKLTLLGQESLGKKLQGVSAWRKSPVYGLYSAMGVQSVMTGKSISDVIVDRQVKNEETLSQSEFEAIVQLNESLAL